jgi:hypothetical protein
VRDAVCLFEACHVVGWFVGLCLIVSGFEAWRRMGAQREGEEVRDAVCLFEACHVICWLVCV